MLAQMRAKVRLRISEYQFCLLCHVYPPIAMPWAVYIVGHNVRSVATKDTPQRPKGAPRFSRSVHRPLGRSTRSSPSQSSIPPLYRSSTLRTTIPPFEDTLDLTQDRLFERDSIQGLSSRERDSSRISIQSEWSDDKGLKQGRRPPRTHGKVATGNEDVGWKWKPLQLDDNAGGSSFWGFKNELHRTRSEFNPVFNQPMAPVNGGNHIQSESELLREEPMYDSVSSGFKGPIYAVKSAELHEKRNQRAGLRVLKSDAQELRPEHPSEGERRRTRDWNKIKTRPIEDPAEILRRNIAQTKRQDRKSKRRLKKTKANTTRAKNRVKYAADIEQRRAANPGLTTGRALAQIYQGKPKPKQRGQGKQENAVRIQDLSLDYLNVNLRSQISDSLLEGELTSEHPTRKDTFDEIVSTVLYLRRVAYDQFKRSEATTQEGIVPAVSVKESERQLALSTVEEHIQLKVSRVRKVWMGSIYTTEKRFLKFMPREEEFTEAELISERRWIKTEIHSRCLVEMGSVLGFLSGRIKEGIFLSMKENPQMTTFEAAENHFLKQEVKIVSSACNQLKQISESDTKGEYKKGKGIKPDQGVIVSLAEKKETVMDIYRSAMEHFASESSYALEYLLTTFYHAKPYYASVWARDLDPKLKPVILEGQDGPREWNTVPLEEIHRRQQLKYEETLKLGLKIIPTPA
ncbi:hypothetical protein BJ875DRAFT_464535 [Amylocarpus encephaloides]|uniref:Uncharacterized protein n=1 Tax=Amylocarpus encephaloides TaxID=45428 RepID=A0A9P7YGW2_9HELO|nr:hypothetical protein BJ875DRAFT_464535 [Amylocarpus encephaloides]